MTIDPFLTGIAMYGGIGFFVGIAIKKLMKILAVVVGVIFAAILYLQSQGVLNINQDKLQHTAENIANTTIQQANHILTQANGNHQMISNTGLLVPMGSFGMAFLMGWKVG